jgi:hypothetical protein
MTSRDFAYWLQGYLEITSAHTEKVATLSEAQVATIQKHLNMVFKHEIDPSFGDAEHQEELSQIHRNFPPYGRTEDGAMIKC